jgi:hypothetical protein
VGGTVVAHSNAAPVHRRAEHDPILVQLYGGRQEQLR